MKRNKATFFLFIIFATQVLSLCAKPGCIDISEHLRRLGDPKTYHFVHCDCPCFITVNDRNQCLECRHYHHAAQWIIVEPTSVSYSPHYYKQKTQSPEQALQRLVNTYLKSRSVQHLGH